MTKLNVKFTNKIQQIKNFDRGNLVIRTEGNQILILNGIKEIVAEKFDVQGPAITSLDTSQHLIITYDNSNLRIFDDRTNWDCVFNREVSMQGDIFQISNKIDLGVDSIYVCSRNESGFLLD